MTLTLQQLEAKLAGFEQNLVMAQAQVNQLAGAVEACRQLIAEMKASAAETTPPAETSEQ